MDFKQIRNQIPEVASKPAPAERPYTADRTQAPYPDPMTPTPDRTRRQLMAKADPRAERAVKLADALRSQSDTGAPFLTASRLRELADPQLTDEDLFKALTHD